MPVIKHKPVDRRNAKSTWLNEFAGNNTSQFGQDGIIEKIFEVIGTSNKMCCEFGAWDGLHYSNTFQLISQRGWTGFLIEGQEVRCKQIIANHNGNSNVHAINSWVHFDGDNSIDAILHRHGADANIDLMVIDVDGVDYHVWESMNDIRPRVVAIEFNGVIPNDVVFIQDRDWTITQGASLLALQELGRDKGYELVAVQGDAFFVQRELFSLFEIEDNSVDAMYFLGGRELKIFQGYDGKLWTAGRRKIMWRNKRDFAADALQILSPEEINRHERVKNAANAVIGNAGG
jgi:hypothetical protein